MEISLRAGFEIYFLRLVSVSLSFSFIRALTSFFTSGTGIFSSRGRWMADLVVTYPSSSLLCSSMTGFCYG